MTTNASNNCEQVELQDLGNGHWRGVYGDRSILLVERGGKLETTLGQLAAWAVMDHKQGPGDLAKIAARAIADGLIDASDIPESATDRPWKERKAYKDWTVTRNAALLLMTRCRTPRAIDLTRAMTKVFEQWLRKKYETRVRKAAKWPQSGSVRDMPASGEADAWICLSEIEKEIHADAKARSAAQRVKEAACEVHEAAKQMPLRGMN